MKARTASLLLLLLAASLPLAAQHGSAINVQTNPAEQRGRAWVSESTCTATARPGGRLVVRAEMGSVTVTPGPDNRVDCRVKVEVDSGNQSRARQVANGHEVGMHVGEDGVFFLNSRFPRGWDKESGRTSVSVSFEIRVPARFSLDLETRGGSVTVERLEGELRAVTAAGSIRTGDVSGPVRVETAGGSIELGNLGNRVEARTAGGHIRVGDVQGDVLLETSGGRIYVGRATGAVRAATAGGDVLIGGSGADVYAQTAGGKIRIGETGGRVRAETAGGSIFVDAARGPVQVQTAGGSIDLLRVRSGVEATTVAGRIQAQFTGTRESYQPSTLENSFGDIEVFLPADLPLTIQAEILQSMGHTITTEFPLQVKSRGSEFGPRQVEGSGNLNGGGELLRLRTTGGNIVIRKLNPQAQVETKKKP